MINKDDPVFRSLVNFYNTNCEIQRPLSTPNALRTLLSARGELTKILVDYSNMAGYTNVHEYLSPIALTLMLHYNWIVEQGIDRKYCISVTPTCIGFDNRYPQYLLDVFEQSWLEVFPHAQLKKCVVRPNLDFKDVEYYCE